MKLRADLLGIATEGLNIESMVLAVRAVCLNHGVRLAIDANSRGKGANGERGRVTMKRLKCVHGVLNRQAHHRLNVTGE